MNTEPNTSPNARSASWTQVIRAFKSSPGAVRAYMTMACTAMSPKASPDGPDAMLKIRFFPELMNGLDPRDVLVAVLPRTVALTGALLIATIRPNDADDRFDVEIRFHDGRGLVEVVRGLMPKDGTVEDENLNKVFYLN